MSWPHIYWGSSLYVGWKRLDFVYNDPLLSSQLGNQLYIYITPTLYTSTFRGCFVSSLLVLDCSFQGGFEGVLIDVVLTHDKF